MKRAALQLSISERKNNGAIAQLVEQRTENPCVPSSILGGTTRNPRRCILRGFVVLLRHEHTQFLAQRKIPVDLHFIARLRHKASGAALGRAAQFALCSRPAYLPAAVPCVRQGLTRHHQIPCRTSSCQWIAEQRHSPRRIAKHLSKAGLCRWQRNFVTRFLQKNLVSICVIDYDANFIEDRKSVAIGDF